MPEAAPRTRIDIRIVDAASAWWAEKRPDITPSGVASTIASAWEEAPEYALVVVDGSGSGFDVTVRAGDSVWRFSLRQGVLSMEGAGIGEDPLSLFGEPAHRRPGRRLLDAVADVAKRTNARRIGMRTTGPGRYGWIRAGFLPDDGSWSMLAPLLLRRLAEAYHRDVIDPKTFDVVSMACVSRSPSAIRILADLMQPTPAKWLAEMQGRVEVPLGRMLLVEGPYAWEAVLEVRDEISTSLLASASFGAPSHRDEARRPDIHPGPWGRYRGDPSTPLLDLGTGSVWARAVETATSKIEGERESMRWRT